MGGFVFFPWLVFGGLWMLSAVAPGRRPGQTVGPDRRKVQKCWPSWSFNSHTGPNLCLDMHPAVMERFCTC